MQVIRFGSSSEYIAIMLPEVCPPNCWLEAKVEIAVNGFRGHIEPSFERDDFERFLSQLKALYEALRGEAELLPRERQLVLRFAGSSGGHVLLKGAAWSKATHENKLEFQIELDQTYLLSPIAELESLLAAKARQ
jgi:hypothetical protein